MDLQEKLRATNKELDTLNEKLAQAAQKEAE